MNLKPQDEPARLAGILATVAVALLALLCYFVPNLVPYEGQIKDLITILSPAIAGFIIREFVTPADKVVVKRP